MKKPWISLRKEVGTLSSGYALLGAGVGAAVYLLTCVASGNFFVYPMLQKPLHSPPQLLFHLLLLLFAALLGYAGGLFAASGRCPGGVKTAGLLFCALALLFLALWYVAIFTAVALLFSLFLALSLLILLAFALKEAWSAGTFPLLFCALAAALSLWLNWFTVSLLLLN